MKTLYRLLADVMVIIVLVVATLETAAYYAHKNQLHAAITLVIWPDAPQGIPVE